MAEEIRMDRLAQANEELKTEIVHAGTLRATLSAMARVDIDTGRSVTIRPAGDGKVLSVLVTPGQTVRQGQVLLTYTDHSLHIMALQKKQAYAALGAAYAALSEAEAAYGRGRALAGAAVATGEVKRRQAIVQEDRDTVIARQADIDTIEHRLAEEFNSPTERIEHEEESALIAPVDGVVRSIPVGVATDISPQTIVAEVADLSCVWITAEIVPDAAARLAPGNAIRFRPPGDPAATPVLSTISTIDGVADPATGLVRVIARAKGPSTLLRPGTMLDATIDTTRQADGLEVPRSALQRMGAHTVVFVQAGPETFFARMVHVRLIGEDTAIVEGSLATGDKVVTDGSFALRAVAALSSDAN
ncbi:efflux RND transporter periplasmic adaptor subunit [Neokomagataea tanensis]|nr:MULTISPECIES: efflux RND transporter periplasmic adaptor subunit [Neokomagataea]